MTQDMYQDDEQLGTHTTADAIHALLHFVRLALNRKAYILGSLIVAGMLGAFYYLTATRVYEADAQLLITQTGPEVWLPNAAGAGSGEALMPTCERLFDSAVVLEGAIRELLKAPPAARLDFADAPRDKWLGVLRQNLTADALRRTNVIEIRYRSKDPKAAEVVVHAVVQSYLAFMDRNHKDESAELVKILELERSDLAGQLATKQQELVAIQARVRDLGLSENPTVVHPSVQRVIRLNESLVQVQQDRLQLEASLAAIRAAVRNGADLRQHLADIEPIIGRELMLSELGLNPKDTEMRAEIERQRMENQARLQTLLKHYGQAHPRVQEVAEAIRSAEAYLANYARLAEQRASAADDARLGPMLIGMVEERLASLWEHESKLGHEYRQAEEEAVQLNDRMAELRLAGHDLQRLRTLHDTLLNRINSIDIGKDRADVRATVVSEPHASDRPVSPRLALIGLIGLLGGLGVGLTLVYVLDVLDDRFRSPEELQQQLGAPLLAMIRELPPLAATGPEAIQVHVAPESVESEAFRTLRTTLAFSGQDMERIAVTSTEPGDGKTTVLANLGVSYAQAGTRCLLIDCDLRRPGLTKMFDLRGQGGVSEILRSDEDVAEMCAARVQSTSVDRLDMIPCGPKPSNPAELLSGPRLSDLLAWAEANYDQILLDCPPILAASDAVIVGRLTDGLILVIQPEKNHRRLVLRAVNGLAAVGLGIGGVVANRISTERNSGYYGYGGYGYGYGYGYDEAEGENAGEAIDSNASREIDGAQAGTSPTVRTNAANIVPRRAA